MQNRDKIFSDIVRDNHGSIYRICLAYLYDKSEAQDLYQEILLQVWQSLASYKGEAKLSTWIYRIAVNTAITYNTRLKKDLTLTLPETINIADVHDDTAGAKEVQLSRLSYAISLLEEQDRLIVSLVLEDLSYKEIADITGYNTNNIGVKITRIKDRLLKLMTIKSATDEF